MTTQRVMTQAANLAGSIKGSTASKQKQTGADFSLLIGKNMKDSRTVAEKPNAQSEAKTPVQASGAKPSTDRDDSDSKITRADNVQNDNNYKAASAKANVQKTDTQSDNIKNTSGSDDANQNQKDDVSVNEQTISQILQMLQTVVQTVMDKLNLSSEEFNQLLNSQGMSAVDLLQPENLQQFILASNGESNITAALTNENLADMLKQLLQTVDNIKAEGNTGLTDDQIQSILKQVESLTEPKTDYPKLSPVSDKEQSASKDNQTVQTETTAVTKSEDNKTSVKTDAEAGLSKDVSVTANEPEKDTPAQSNSDSNADKNLNNMDKFQNFVDKLVNAAQDIQIQFKDEISQVSSIRDIANQIIDNIKVSVSADQSSMELQLNPESLGKVNLSVQSKDGIMTAHFVVQNEISKEAIESQMQSLKDSLQQQGLKVDAIEVTVSSYAFDKNSNDTSENQQESNKSNTGRHISLEDAVSMENSTTEESSENNDGIRGGLIDYTA